MSFCRAGKNNVTLTDHMFSYKMIDMLIRNGPKVKTRVKLSIKKISTILHVLKKRNALKTHQP